MNAAHTKPDRSIKLLFEMSRDDNPRLFDEQLAQGVKRVNRLRVLAYDGLLAQYGVFGFAKWAGHLRRPGLRQR